MTLKYLFAKLIAKLRLPAVIASETGRGTKICSGASVSRCVLGRYSYVGPQTGISHARIGSFCSIAGNCSIGAGSHPVDFVSTSPAFLSGKNCMGVHFFEHPYDPYKETVIGSDVWIGENSFIKGGVTVGDGAVIGAHSVVTHDVPPYAIVAGTPAKIIRFRFDEETIKALLELKWWDFSDDELKKYGKYFNDPQMLMQEYSKNKTEGLE
jgi:acetyltransferase-like isoleucine patch superfamily enzyme